MKFNYAYVLINKEVRDDNTFGVYHFCGYETQPTIDDYNSLLEELKDDPEFGWGPDFDNFKLVEASQDVLDHFNKLFEKD